MNIPAVTLDQLKALLEAKYGPPGPEHDLRAYQDLRAGFEDRARTVIPGIGEIHTVWIGYVSGMGGKSPKDDVEFVAWGEPEEGQLRKPETFVGRYGAMTVHGDIEQDLPLSVVEYECAGERKIEFVPADINEPRGRIIDVSYIDYVLFKDRAQAI